jgi:4'-phosphopantetheinyl transferase EntD
VSIFAGLLDARFAISERPITEAAPAIFPEEAKCVAHAVEKRRREFLAGRACAHEALDTLGAPSVALLPGSDRAPIWPQGFIGSITHTDRHCAAAVAKTGREIRSVGIDLEPAEPLSADLWETVCRREERAWLEMTAADERGLLARAIFSAKECAFKAQFPLTQTLLEFEEIAVTIDLARELFTASFLSGAPKRSAPGRVRIANGLLATALSL